jgi:hypothetical protein
MEARGKELRVQSTSERSSFAVNTSMHETAYIAIIYPLGEFS